MPVSNAFKYGYQYYIYLHICLGFSGWVIDISTYRARIGTFRGGRGQKVTQVDPFSRIDWAKLLQYLRRNSSKSQWGRLKRFLAMIWPHDYGQNGVPVFDLCQLFDMKLPSSVIKFLLIIGCVEVNIWNYHTSFRDRSNMSIFIKVC